MVALFMSRTTASVSFYCRESKKTKDGRAPIELTIVINNKRCYIQLPRKEYPDQFKEQTTGKKRTDLTDYLDGIRTRLNQIATTFLMEGRPLTADALKSYFQTGGYQIYTVENLFNDYMHILKKRVGKDLTQKSYRKYEIARHTYATRCLNRGIRLEVVAKLLGHSTTRITQHYAKLLKNNIINEVKDAFEKSY